MQRLEGHVRTSVVILAEHDKKLTEIAKRFGIKKSEAHRQILETGLDSYAAFEGIGLVKLAELTKKTREALAKKRQLSLI